MNVYLNPTTLPTFQDWVALDIETSGLDPRLDKLWSIALSDGVDVWIYTKNFDLIISLLLDPEVTKIAHNMLFEYTWMMHYLGVEIQGLYDTLLVEKIISEDDSLPMSLDEVIGRYIGIYLTKDVRKTFETHQAGRPFTSEQIEYICNDVLYLGKIVEQQVEEVNKKDLQRTVELEFEVLVAVAHLEYNGLAFDKDLWQTQVETMQVMLLELETQMRELIGKDYVLQVAAKKKGEEYIKEIPCEEINLNSPKQLMPLFNQRFCLEVDSTGMPFLDGITNDLINTQMFLELAFNADPKEIKQYLKDLKKDLVPYTYENPFIEWFNTHETSFVVKLLKRIKDFNFTSFKNKLYSEHGPGIISVFTEYLIDHKEHLESLHKIVIDLEDIIILLGEYRKWSKRLGFAYEQFIHPITGKIHPSYHQLGARTGRFSCSNPNLQQVPRPDKTGPNLRQVWVADSEDYVIIRADYSQQEPRVFANLCGDPAMIDACNKQDVYIEFGKIVYGKEVEKGGDERQIMKVFVLAKGFGAGIDRLVRTSGKDKNTVIEAYNAIENAFPIMSEFARKMYKQANMYRYVTTAIGRRRYFSVPSFTEAVNTPVQGTAADMFKLALVKVHRGLTELKNSGKIDSKTRVWNLVHDEIEVHCHKDEVEFLLPLVKEWMEEAGREICPKVLHVAELKYSYRWDK